MRYLYVDNFRGFQDTYIPIVDVNFLVGENSTGKTSILSLISLLGAPQFWLSQDFNTNEVQLGHFRDIVSASSHNQRNFKIGVIECAEPDEQGETQDEARAFLLTFDEEEGLPIIRQCHRLYGQDEVRAVFTKKTIRYGTSKLSFNCERMASIQKRFQEWTHQDENLTGLKVLGARIPFGRRNALPFLRALVEMHLGEEGSDSATRRFSLDIPGFMDMDIPGFALWLSWIGPIRTKPKRTYDSYQVDTAPGGEHTPYLIKRLLRRKATTSRFERFIARFGTESNLFESVDVRSFGRQLTDPFELRAILNKVPLRVSEVGYGVSQVLPIVVEAFAREKGHWFAIQQPEVHLHPRAQAAIGDVIFRLATEENKRFLIETHSEYIVDRFRLNYKGRQEQPDIASQVLFFERNEGGNKVTPIEILENGEYSPSQPKTFREFFVLEELELLGL